jgi:hypothetical protein
MTEIYTNPKKPGSLSGISGFTKNNPHHKNELQAIKKLEAYALHKQVRRKFKGKRYFQIKKAQNKIKKAQIQIKIF